MLLILTFVDIMLSISMHLMGWYTYCKVNHVNKVVGETSSGVEEVKNLTRSLRIN